jgi:YVTN family beta-propeller protein
MIPWGTDGSFIVATNLTQETPAENGIFLYSANAPKSGEPKWTKTQLVGNQWNAAVNVMAQYDQVLTDSNGVPVPTTYTGTPISGANALKLAVGSTDPSSLIGQAITGDGIAAGTVITGFVSSDVTGVTYSINNAITATTSTVAVTLPDKPTIQPGLVVGLSDGSVYYWNGNICTDSTCVGPAVNGIQVAVPQTANKPVSIAVTPDGSTVYSAGNSISIIDSATNAIIGNLPAAWESNSFPSVVVAPDGGYAYATASFSGSSAGLQVINTATNTIATSIALPTGAFANAVVISPDGSYGYIANNNGSPSLFQFDTATNALTGTNIALPGGDYARTGLVFSADGSTLYVSNAANGTISLLDTATNTLLAQQITVGGSPGQMALSPDGASLIVTQTPNFNSNTIAVVNTATNTPSNFISVGNGPAGVAFNPNPGLPYAYVTNSNSSTVSVIDTRTWSVIGTFPTGNGGDDTLDVGVTPDGLHIYLANWDGAGNDSGTVPVIEVATPVAQGWAQLQASDGWGSGIAVNNITSLPNNLGFAIGLTNGTLATWNNPILGDGTIVPTSNPTGCSNGSPGGCWNVLPDNDFTWVDAIVPSGQTGGFVAIGWNANSGDSGAGWMQGFNGAPFAGGAPFDNSFPTTLMPYDGTTLVGSIGSAPVVAENGVISAPSYMSSLPDLSASTAGCSGSYNSGSGAGCAGYVLTVQEAAGNAIRVGQTLYGGPGLAAGTVITQQISDGDGNLCVNSCNAGSTGVYLVNTSQLVAPGTPMSASDGTGWIVGFSNGAVAGWNNGLGQLVDGTTWYSSENVMIPWRDGFVTGLNNGAVMYWSPSNTPAGGTTFLPDNNTSMALNYAGSTIASQLLQPPGWSQLQGPVGQAATSMVQVGDGFAMGLTSPNGSSNGMVQLFNGFGASSRGSAFGYEQTASGLAPQTASNAWTTVASESALPGPENSVGSIQALVPIHELVKDSAGNWWNATSLVVGQTNNGLNSWTGSNLNTAPSGNAWNQLQTPAALPGQLDATNLQAMWNFATASNAPSGSFGTKGAVGGSTDPIFGQLFNQANCGSCNGDFQTFAFNYPFGNDGVIYQLGSGALTADLNMSAAGYGYLYIPAGIWDKFEPDDYSAGLVLGVQAGPSIVLTPPDGLSVKETVTASTSYTDQQVTDIGVFGETIGIDASLTGSMGLSTKPLGPLTLAYANFTPGLLFTWNSNGNPDSLAMSYSAYTDSGYISPEKLESYFDPTGKAVLSATVTPYASVSYGLFTNTPIDLDIFKLSVGYQNPITATLTVPIDNFDNTSLSLSSQGFLTASAAFIPGITSDLSWNSKYPLYSVKDAIQVANYI